MHSSDDHCNSVCFVGGSGTRVLGAFERHYWMEEGRKWFVVTH